MIFDSSIFDVPIVNNVIVFDEADSTNNQAKKFGKEGCVDGTLIVADCQTKGRGRMGRSFDSPSGEGIYMSILIKPDIEAGLVPQITLLAGLAVSRALEKNYYVKTTIKWPNDLLINNKKFVGILTEKCGDFLVIGIGVNVNNTRFDTKLFDKATSLCIETGKEYEREKMIAEILSEFSDLYYGFLESKSLKFVLEEYNGKLLNYDKDIYIIPHELTEKLENSYQISDDSLPVYHCMGIAVDGSLICRDKDGILSQIASGEISIRNKA